MIRTTAFRFTPFRLGTAGAVSALVLASAVTVLAASAGSATSTTAASHPVSYSAVASFTRPPHKGHVIEPESAYPHTLKHGYTEHELFASGRASAFKAKSKPSDGKWPIVRTSSAHYRTRILVRVPPKSRFNGTVVVEWMNVTEGEAAPDWDFLNPMIMRAGYAYVAVSDQALGVNGGKSLLGGATYPGLVGSEPSRYGSLHHPGDKYSQDIFAQIGTALHNPDTAARVLDGLHPRRIVATGESQSAFYLTTFANALQPRTHAYDGIFIHSRGGGADEFTGSIGLHAKPVRIRTDLDVPVFMFETQTDLILLGYAGAQQPNTHLIRTWEVAGTSHADTYVVGPYASLLGCTSPINDGPQHVVVQAAFAAFNKWVAHGTEPPTPHPFSFTSKKPAILALAPDGDVRGGVRSPAVNVPISTLSGAAPTGANETCSLFGSTTPFTKAELINRYGSPSHYVADFRTSLSQAVARGYILKAEQTALLTKAGKVTF
jgi:hypothetical protein